MASDGLNVLYVSYPLLPVSDESCGGAEQMLSTLEAEMHARGHRTTVAACDGSRVAGRLFPTGPETTEPDRFSERDSQHQQQVLKLIQNCGDRLNFNLVHDESGTFWRRAPEIDLPVLATLHLPRHFYPQNAFEQIPPNLSFNCVSESQRETFADVANLLGVVPNGIRVERFPFLEEKQDYLLWMGRICEEKGPHLAIEVAQRTGLPLILSGQVYPFSYHQAFYSAKVRPFLGGTNPSVCFIETPTFQTKAKLLSNARALLVTSLVNETSSLVSMEAMACGTPVIGFRFGAIPEVVQHGETGFVVDDVEQMVEAVWHSHEINPHACRVHAEVNYSSSRMAQQYESLYQQVLRMHAERHARAA